MSLMSSKNSIFPNVQDKLDDVGKQNIQIQTYGQRLYRDQTLYEYLLEFLVIFSSKKSLGRKRFEDASHEFQFLLDEQMDKQLFYYPIPRMGLKRFIFLNRSELEKRFNVDILALEQHRELLQRKINIDGSSLQDKFVLDVLQDLLYGFNAIIGKRSWFAQSLLPIAPELIFCEAIGKKDKRKSMSTDPEDGLRDIDGEFDFNYRAFMARSGEVYYLHVLQGLEERPDMKIGIESQLHAMITNVPQLRNIAQFIQDSWRNSSDLEMGQEKVDYVVKRIEWIPESYRTKSAYTVMELHNLLHSSVDTLAKVDMFSALIALQVMRMMCTQAYLKLEGHDGYEWLIDVINEPSNQIRKRAVASYERIEERVFSAVHTANIKKYMKEAPSRNEEAIYEDAAKDTGRLLRKLGKQIGFVVPPKGGNMRFGINEDLIKVLVLSLVPPGERMLYTTFLEKCYEHFKIIIGPFEAQKHWYTDSSLDLTMFNLNSEKLQTMLKDCGFLRDLSDSTSIVENPF